MGKRNHTAGRKKRVVRYALLSIAVLAISFALFVLGFVTSKYGLASPYLRKIKTVGKELLRMDESRERTIHTIFLSLNVREVDVPVTSSGHGGGLTSFGDALVLLTHDGLIYTMQDDDPLRTSMRTPDHGLETYMKVAALPEYRNLLHDFDYFRYNDILHYAYDSIHYLVLSYTEWSGTDTSYHSTIARLRLPEGTENLTQVSAEPDDWEIMFRTSPGLPLKSIGRAIEGHAAGGRMAYKGEHTILFASGDYFWDGVQAPQALSQDRSNDYGKVLEIDLSQCSSKIISIGHRNPQGLIIDKDSGVWVTEHGPRGGDELNKIFENENYGWPVVTLGTQYNRLPYPSVQHYGRHDDFRRPVYAWLPSKGISCLAQISQFAPSWDGDFLAGSLTGRTLFRVRVREDRVVFSEPIYLDDLIRYIHPHSDGRIALWTDSNKVLWMTTNGDNYSNDVMDNLVERSPELHAGKENLKRILTLCQQCHSFTTKTNERGPYLGDIYGKEIAANDYAHYSPSLSSKKGTWTPEALRKYLINPQKFAPGSSMPMPHIQEDGTITDLIDFFRRLEDYQKGEEF